MKKSQKQFLQEIPTPTSDDMFIIGQKKSSCFQEDVFLAFLSWDTISLSRRNLTHCNIELFFVKIVLTLFSFYITILKMLFCLGFYLFFISDCCYIVI